ncbi:MAG TPA: 50S ribosomal protein L25 [Chloroflexi bacterium]|nr:50S ribosomal protein L25 [Chloroflexota bacterium]
MSQQREQVELVAQPRVVLGKQVKQLRREGWTPGVMYGHGFEPVHLQFETRQLQHILDQVGGSQLIAIQVQEQGKPEMALVRDVQRDPIRQTVLHVDFYRVKMTERLTTEIPLEMVGESPLTERREGILLIGISSVEVECLPGDLVDAIEVDLADLVEIDQAIYVHDLAIPASIDVLTDPDEMIVRIAPLEEEEVLEELEEEVLMPAIEEVEIITEADSEERFSEEG